MTNQKLVLLLTFGLVLTGCSGSQRDRHGKTNDRIGIFDGVANSSSFSNAIVQADRDLIGDRWESIPVSNNLSRAYRVGVIAQKILLEIAPQIKDMTVTELVRCLKVQDGSGFVSGHYIGDVLYPQGNEMIISEIASRPEADRSVLLDWPLDGSPLTVGSSGEHREMYEVIEQLSRRAARTTNRLSR